MKLTEKMANVLEGSDQDAAKAWDKRNNAINKAKELDVKKQPKDIQNAVAVINSIGPSLSDAPSSQKADYKKAMALLDKKGFVMSSGKLKKISESDSETIMDVLDSYAQTLEDLSKGVKAYKTNKLERRVKSDYAGNEKKLKEIGKVIMDAELATAKAYKQILKVVG